MTQRQDEIIKAIEEIFLVTEDCKPTYEMIGFRLGAEWADEHPKSLWISVNDDLPYNYPNNIRFGITNNVIATDGTSIFILHMKRCKDNKWIWCGDDSVDDTVYSVVFSNSITHWMPFPKPPKNNKIVTQ